MHALWFCFVFEWHTMNTKRGRSHGDACSCISQRLCPHPGSEDLEPSWIHGSPAVTVSEEPNGTASSRPHRSHHLPLCSKYKVENPPSPPLLHFSHLLPGQILLTGVLTPETWSRADLCGSSLGAMLPCFSKGHSPGLCIHLAAAHHGLG